VKDTASSVGKLPACVDENKNDVSLVGQEYFVCYEMSWVKITDEVISESDLGKCGSEILNVYVLGKMKNYACRDGKWYKNGKEVELSSVEEYVSDGKTKVRGVCMPSVNKADPNEKVSWRFISMGGTAESYNWKFEGGSPATSTDEKPSVAFTGKAEPEVKLVVNKGLPSESEEITCSSLVLTGIPVTGCKCTMEQKSPMSVSGYDPITVNWKVEGCSGGAPYTYDWDMETDYYPNVTADGPKYTLETYYGGTFTPVVSVTNKAGESMNVTCPTMAVSETMFAECYINDDNQLVVRNINGLSEYVDDVDMTIYSDEKTSKKVTVSYYGNELDLPSVKTAGLHSYYLVSGSDTVCTAASGRCFASPDYAHVGEKVTWQINVENANIKSYSWIAYDDGEILATGNEKTLEVAYTRTGSFYSRLIVDEGLPTEKELECTGVNVNPYDIENCECEVELASTSNDLNEVKEVSYKMTVSGCSSEGSESFDYQWLEGVVSKNNEAMVTYTQLGRYYEGVWVFSQDGNSTAVTCEASVKNSQYEEINLESGTKLNAGKYVIQSCDGDSWSDSQWTFDKDFEKNYKSWFESGMYENDGVVAYTFRYPVLVNIPEGQSMTVESCDSWK